MKVKAISGGVCAPKGFLAAGVNAGVKPGSQKLDMMMIVSQAPCSAAAVYTQNKVQGAPIAVTRAHLANGRARAVLCNSGNANTCCPGGEDLARQCCALAAGATGLAAEDFIVASTGVIGQPMSAAPFEKGIPALAGALSANGGDDAARAIMTTDTVPKAFAAEFEAGGKTCRIGAIGKGSGMINPNMATMLVFVTTDAAVAPDMLQKALAGAVAPTLNQICVDGDTSTNDMACVLANGMAGNADITAPGADYDALCAALLQVLTCMAIALAADGEGATKLIQCDVLGAPDDGLARRIAKSVISSDLLKAALFGADANWGRILCAIGYTPGDFSVGDISVTLAAPGGGSVLVCEHSAHHPFSEEEAARILAGKQIIIRVNLHDGSGSGAAWGCDLTYDYVKINGDYRS